MLIYFVKIHVNLWFLQGNFCIYKLNDEEESDDDNSSRNNIFSQVALKVKDDEPPTPELRLLKDLPPNKPIEVKVIVYIIKVSGGLTHCYIQSVFWGEDHSIHGVQYLDSLERPWLSSMVEIHAHDCRDLANCQTIQNN